MRMSDSSANLSAAYAAWCRFLKENDPEGVGLPLVCARLGRFSSAHRPTPEHVGAVTDALYRGVPLLTAALGWEEARVGGSAEHSTPTDAVRGEQWRLVMAYGGFETVARALLAQPQRAALGLTQLVSLLARCGLSQHVPLEVPAHSEAMRDRWFQAEPDVLLEFLGLDGEDALAVSRWLADRQPALSWSATLGLAKALRTATVCGALSASKVKEWKLLPAIRTLVDNLAQITAAALQRLTAPEDAPVPPTPAPAPAQEEGALKPAKRTPKKGKK
jgi:hypothetical protein